MGPLNIDLVTYQNLPYHIQEYQGYPSMNNKVGKFYIIYRISTSQLKLNKGPLHKYVKTKINQMHRPVILTDRISQRRPFKNKVP